MAYQLRPGFLFNKLGIPGLSERAYSTKVRAIAPANLIAYWKLSEKTGTNAVNLEGTAARDGTYTGVTLNSATGPGGQPVGLWDGAVDYCDIYSASLATAFNGAEGTVALWVKVSGAGAWTDSTIRTTMMLGADGTNNYVYIRKTATNNQIQITYKVGGTAETVTDSSLAGDTGWNHFAVTWSVVADEAKFYINGSQIGATGTSLGTWSGALAANFCLVGAFEETAPDQLWDGYLAHAAIWTTPLTPAQIASLAVV